MEPLVVVPVTLEGEHVRLIPMETSHLDDLYAASLPREIWDYMPTQINSKEELSSWMTSSLNRRESGLDLPFVVVDKKSERIVGSTRFLDIMPEHRGLEIGSTWLNPSVWRTPVNTECKLLLLTHCFETLGTIRVQLKTDSRNVRSQTAIARIGGVREGVIRQQMIMPGDYIRDSVYFSIIDKEWREVKLNLISMLNKNRSK